MRRVTITIIALISCVWGEQFTQAYIQKFLHKQNKNLVVLFAKPDISKSKAKQAHAPLDITTALKSEQKNYPLTSSSYNDVRFSKAFENGVTLSSGFRKSSGTQEYNNIKTAKDGELISSIGITLNQLFEGLGLEGYAYQKAHIQYTIDKAQTAFSVQHFYFRVLQSYFTLLMLQEQLTLHDTLVNNAVQREYFIKQKSEQGYYPEIALVEAKANTNQYRQKRERTKIELAQSKLELAYLLDTPHQTLYDGMQFPTLPTNHVSLQAISSYIQTAQTKRPDIQAIQYLFSGLGLEEKRNQLIEFPTTDLRVTHVNDLQNSDGYKVEAFLRFPFAQSAYKGKKQELVIRRQALKAKQDNLMRHVRTAIEKLTTTIDQLETIKASQIEQVAMLERILHAERIRFKEGVSTLLILIQRERALLNAQETLLKTRLEHILAHKQLQLEIGELYDTF